MGRIAERFGYHSHSPKANPPSNVGARVVRWYLQHGVNLCVLRRIIPLKSQLPFNQYITPPTGQSTTAGSMRMAAAGPASTAMKPHTTSNIIKPILLNLPHPVSGFPQTTRLPQKSGVMNQLQAAVTTRLQLPHATPLHGVVAFLVDCHLPDLRVRKGTG